jgi:hypothetical protein
MKEQCSIDQQDDATDGGDRANQCPGSEVLGYDTEMSTDHDWGPRVYLFLNEQDIGYSDQIQVSLYTRAPERFYGFPVDVRMSVITTVQCTVTNPSILLPSGKPLENLTKKETPTIR